MKIEVIRNPIRLQRNRSSSRVVHGNGLRILRIIDLVIGKRSTRKNTNILPSNRVIRDTSIFQCFIHTL